MNRYVAFLRGMNLGGRRITNEALRSHFETLGCEDVATFRASGNVIFARAGRPASLTRLLEEGLAEALDYEVPVFLRSAKEVIAMAAYEPFDAKALAASEGQAPGGVVEAPARGRPGPDDDQDQGHDRPDRREILLRPVRVTR